MKKLFSEFPKTSKEDWEKILVKELKGADFNTFLNRYDEIEELEYDTYAHVIDATKQIEAPNNYPFTRGAKTQNNDWAITTKITVSDEKTANELALKQLSTGSTALIFILEKKDIHFDQLFESIEFEYIQTQFEFKHQKHIEEVANRFNELKKNTIFFRIDFTSIIFKDSFGDISLLLKTKNIPFAFVNSYELEQVGANNSQQIAFSLSTAHEYLLKLVETGYSFQEANEKIHFSLGIGNNYFIEIAKFRVLRKLWSTILTNYAPTLTSTFTNYITAEIGFLNKSLKDPYTNLLRQTTEGMSAVLGGVNALIIHPYDSFSTKGTSTLAARMAVNISLILKDESYFDQVIDPIGGSYSIELITDKLAKKSWETFQLIDAKGGIFNTDAINELQQLILEKVKSRIEQIQTGKKVLIGINKFPNPQVEENSWLEGYTYFGLKQLVLEREIIL